MDEFEAASGNDWVGLRDDVGTAANAVERLVKIAGTRLSWAFL